MQIKLLLNLKNLEFKAQEDAGHLVQSSPDCPVQEGWICVMACCQTPRSAFGLEESRSLSSALSTT